MNGMAADFLVAADQIFILVLLIAAGYAAVSTGIMDPRATRGLSGLLINVTIPALIIASIRSLSPLHASLEPRSSSSRR